MSNNYSQCLVTVPNLRRMLKPDPNHIILSCDLAGADAQVVAWEAEDEDLKNAFRKGFKIHVKNGLDLWGPAIVGEDGRREPYYTMIKSGVHAANYGAHARTIARVIKGSVAQGQAFINKWFSLHPNIRDKWHQRVRHEVFSSRTATNRFGFRITFFDRIDDSTVRDALAWGPQSTVALVTDKGMVNVYEHLFPHVKPLLQVHDEGVYQIHKSNFGHVLPELREHLSITIPYDDPLVIPVGLKASSRSWGDCEAVEWDSGQEWLEANGK